MLRSAAVKFTQFEASNVFVCYKHLKNLAAGLRISTTALKTEELQRRVSHVCTHYNQLGNLMTNIDTYKWFYESARPSRPTDKLGPFRSLCVMPP